LLVAYRKNATGGQEEGGEGGNAAWVATAKRIEGGVGNIEWRQKIGRKKSPV